MKMVVFMVGQIHHIYTWMLWDIYLANNFEIHPGVFAQIFYTSDIVGILLFLEIDSVVFHVCNQLSMGGSILKAYGMFVWVVEEFWIISNQRSCGAFKRIDENN